MRRVARGRSSSHTVRESSAQDSSTQHCLNCTHGRQCSPVIRHVFPDGLTSTGEVLEGWRSKIAWAVEREMDSFICRRREGWMKSGGRMGSNASLLDAGNDAMCRDGEGNLPFMGYLSSHHPNDEGISSYFIHTRFFEALLFDRKLQHSANCVNSGAMGPTCCPQGIACVEQVGHFPPHLRCNTSFPQVHGEGTQKMFNGEWFQL